MPRVAFFYRIVPLVFPLDVLLLLPLLAHSHTNTTYILHLVDIMVRALVGSSKGSWAVCISQRGI